MNTETHRFKAEWIEKQHMDESGDWIPDKDEYGEAFFKTFDEAHAAAVKNSKRAGQAEWVRIAEQHVVHEDDDGYRFKRWETLRSWTGDYDGLDETH